MRRPTTSAWTDVHLPLVSGVVITSGLSWAAAQLGGDAWPLLTLTALTLAVASLLDALGGLAVGILGAAGAVLLEHRLPGIASTGLAAHLAVAGLLLLLGVNTGLLAERVRHGRRVAHRVADRAVVPSTGSLGLLGSDDAALRIEEELIRARLHDRPLAVAMVRVDITDPSLGRDDVVRVHRAVARTLESELRATDVPFVEATGEFGVVMPESSRSAAADVLESVLMLTRQATFADRTRHERRTVDEVATVWVGLRDMRAAGATASSGPIVAELRSALVAFDPDIEPAA